MAFIALWVPAGRGAGMARHGDSVPGPLAFFALRQRHDRGTGDVV